MFPLQFLPVVAVQITGTVSQVPVVALQIWLPVVQAVPSTQAVP
jgi:hypothetical protein